MSHSEEYNCETEKLRGQPAVKTAYRYYVGGEFRRSTAKLDVVNPATEEVFAEIYETPKDDLDFAIARAKAAQRQWQAVPPKGRAQILREIAKTICDNLRPLAELETQEIGKNLKESLFVDIPLAADCFNYYASFLESWEEEFLPSELGLDWVEYAPFGVAGVYLPYNVPLMIFGFSCAAALAAGNALVIKASEYGALSLLALAKSLDNLDIPKGLINIVTGKGETVGKLLAASDVDIISFTGTAKTLKKVIVHSAENPKKIICELGGSNLTVVFNDANKEDALQNILAASFMKQGQMCIGTSFILVQEDSYKDFVNALVKKASDITLGDPFLPGTGIGALPTRAHLEDVHRRVKEWEAAGARVLCGGRIVPGKGYFYPATVIEVDEVTYDEFFAPVVLVKSFSTREELDSILQANPTGLVLQIWTQDLTAAKRYAAEARCGTVWINTFAQMSSHTPFGGAGKSGWGRNLGKAGFFEYVQPKHVGIGLKQSPVWGWFGV